MSDFSVAMYLDKKTVSKLHEDGEGNFTLAPQSFPGHVIPFAPYDPGYKIALKKYGRALKSFYSGVTEPPAVLLILFFSMDAALEHALKGDMKKVPDRPEKTIGFTKTVNLLNYPSMVHEWKVFGEEESENLLAHAQHLMATKWQPSVVEAFAGMSDYDFSVVMYLDKTTAKKLEGKGDLSLAPHCYSGLVIPFAPSDADYMIALKKYGRALTVFSSGVTGPPAVLLVLFFRKDAALEHALKGDMQQMPDRPEETIGFTKTVNRENYPSMEYSWRDIDEEEGNGLLARAKDLMATKWQPSHGSQPY